MQDFFGLEGVALRTDKSKKNLGFFFLVSYLSIRSLRGHGINIIFVCLRKPVYAYTSLHLLEATEISNN